jgi:histidinol-phosphatase (PHP family)
LSLKVGLEVGFDIKAEQQIHEYLRDKDFDFLIGSLHFINEVDLFRSDFFSAPRIQEAVREYFQALLEGISLFDFSVLGHITLFKRFFERLKVNPSDINWSNYDEMITSILQELINQGKGIELNMRVPLIDLDFQILRLYKELGGEIITLGSDAHHIRSMQTMKEGFEALRATGFKHYCLFENRKPLFVPIG